MIFVEMLPILLIVLLTIAGALLYGREQWKRGHEQGMQDAYRMLNRETGTPDV